MLNIRFRRSPDYTYDKLIRDLIDLTTELNTRLEAIEARLDDLESS